MRKVVIFAFEFKPAKKVIYHIRMVMEPKAEKMVIKAMKELFQNYLGNERKSTKKLRPKCLKCGKRDNSRGTLARVTRPRVTTSAALKSQY